MNEERKSLIQSRAKMVLEVLSQVDIASGEEARKAVNLVYAHCRKATCRNKEEEDVFDAIFYGRMPL